MNIVFLQSKEHINRAFTDEYINRLRQYGEVVIQPLPRDLTIDETKRQIRGAEIVITSWGCQPLTEEILAEAPNLRFVLHAAGTVKGIATEALFDRGVRISSAAAALGRGVAETALGMTIASLKDMWRLSRSTRDNEWGHVAQVTELFNVTIGVIGAGRAGAHYLKLLQAFEVETLVYDPFYSEEKAVALGTCKVELDELVKRSDLISIHAPSIPETYRMINKERMALMKDTCILINTARGSIIDEEALVAELRKGRLFACLDVTDPEPPALDHPFRHLPNVVLTPHIAGAVNNGLGRIGHYITRELEAYLQGKQLDGEVRKEQLNMLA